MRISTASWYRSQAADVTRLQSGMAAAQQRIATGKRLTTAADDPVAAARAERFVRQEGAAATWKANAETAARRLDASSGALFAMADGVLRLKELALAATSDTMGPADRHIVAAEAREVRETLLTLANSRDADGRYLFAGAEDGKPAFVRAGERIVWNGGGKAAAVPVGRERSIAMTAPGNRILSDPSAEQSLFDIADAFIAGLTATAATDTENPDARATRQAALGDSLAALGRMETHLAEASAAEGARLVQADATVRAQEDIALEARVARSGLEDTDIAEAIIELEQRLTLLQAVQAGFTRIAGLSLFNRL